MAEVHQIFLRKVVPEEIEEGVVQHGTVPRRENKAVPVFKTGIFRAEFQKIVKQRDADGRGTEGKPRVPGVRPLDGFCGEDPDRVHRFLTEIHK